LLGCDYCDKIRGIGDVRAYEFITKYKNLETIIKNLGDKYQVPENFDFERVRKLFKNPDVQDPKTMDLKWENPDEEGLIQFLVKEKSFAEDRVRSGIEKLKKCRQTSVQDRLTSYFGPIVVKRKREDEEDTKSPKKAKNGKNTPTKGNSKSPVKGAKGPVKGAKGKPMMKGKK